MGMTLYAGPWIGEFGWELLWWNPIVRHEAETKKYDRVIVASHTDSRYLYEFADEYIPLDAYGWNLSMGRMNSGAKPVVKADVTLGPNIVAMPRRRNQRSRKFRKLSPENPICVADVLCAFRPPKKNMRNPQKANSRKAYPRPRCEKLVELLQQKGYRLAAYGGTDNWIFDGMLDLRGLPLEWQCSALAAASCAVGPSSGPMHLAHLCECPVVTWYAGGHSRKRYLDTWNPFKVSATFVGTHIPSPDEVLKAVIQEAEKHRKKKKC